MQRTGAGEEHATLLEVMADLVDAGRAGEPMRRLVEGDRDGRLALGDSPEDAWLDELAARLYGERGAERSRRG